jgi:hypothetical protein
MGRRRMKKRSIAALVTVAAVAAAMWFGGRILWNIVLALHGR